MRALLLVAVLSGFHEAKPLEPAASFVAQKPAIVWCANSDIAWKRFLGARSVVSDAHGVAVPNTDQLWIDPIVCETLSIAAKNSMQPYDYPSLAPSIEVLTHESIHLRGSVDEGSTDCSAMHETPGVAVRFFHVRAGKRLRALMAQAWSWHAELTAAYRSVC